MIELDEKFRFASIIIFIKIDILSKHPHYTNKVNSGSCASSDDYLKSISNAELRIIVRLFQKFLCQSAIDI